jgi:hypothetical protein
VHGLILEAEDIQKSPFKKAVELGSTYSLFNVKNIDTPVIHEIFNHSFSHIDSLCEDNRYDDEEFLQDKDEYELMDPIMQRRNFKIKKTGPLENLGKDREFIRNHEVLAAPYCEKEADLKKANE